MTDETTEVNYDAETALEALKRSLDLVLTPELKDAVAKVSKVVYDALMTGFDAGYDTGYDDGWDDSEEGEWRNVPSDGEIYSAVSSRDSGDEQPNAWDVGGTPV